MYIKYYLLYFYNSQSINKIFRFLKNRIFFVHKAFNYDKNFTILPLAPQGNHFIENYHNKYLIYKYGHFSFAQKRSR